MNEPGFDKQRWAQLDPLLDELLDLDKPAREQRLAALRAADAALADELAGMLARMEALDAAAFLNDPAAPARPAPMEGLEVGAYTIVRELGEGGMGSVWLARRTDGRFEGEVAIKFLHAGLLARGDGERFAREGSILARLAHPHIARLIDAGVMPSTGQPYLVLEYIAGERIDEYCEHRALDPIARVRLFLDVLSAVAHAHNRLILHRDLKPSNILVTAAGEVKLLDFGIATLLQDGTGRATTSELTQRAGRAFTPQYAAPEQLRGEDVTTATDVYALGVLLYVLLGGMHPLADPTQGAVDNLRAALEQEPRLLSDAVRRKGGPGAARRARALAGDLDTIVGHALKKLPAERYANAAEMADDLRRFLNEEPISARPDALGYQMAKFIRRHRLGVGAGAVAALALAVGAGVANWEAREARHQREQAEGLIEFMLGDLRKRLQPVGRLEALDAVGSKALAYYAGQDADQLDADSLGRRARALHLIGEIAEQRGSLAEASKVFEQAAATTGELLARHPNEPQRLFDHSQSQYWVGYVARRRGLVQEAEAAFQRYLELATRLVELEPGRQEWRMERGYASSNIGIMLLETARPGLAVKPLAEAAAIWGELARTQPEILPDQATALGWLAKAREALGEYAEAAQLQQDKVALVQAAPGTAKDRDLQRVLANGHYELGRLSLLRGQPQAAESSAMRAVEAFDALVAVDASNLDWLAQASFARASLAEILGAQGKTGPAAAVLGRADADLARLLAADSQRAKWSVSLQGGLLGAHAWAAGWPQRAPQGQQVALDRYLATAEKAGAAGAVRDTEQRRVVAQAQLMLGDARAAAGQVDQARSHWEAALLSLDTPTPATEPPALALAALARLRLGDAQVAGELAEKLRASSYRHPLYDALVSGMGVRIATVGSR